MDYEFKKPTHRKMTDLMSFCYMKAGSHPEEKEVYMKIFRTLEKYRNLKRAINNMNVD